MLEISRYPLFANIADLIKTLKIPLQLKARDSWRGLYIKY